MAKRGARRAEIVAEPAPPEERGSERQFIVFHCADRVFALPAHMVSEVLRVPNLAHMPLAPRSLLGLANVRGVVLPVISLASLLGLPAETPSDSSRLILVDRGSPVGLVVDRIDSLQSWPEERIEKNAVGAGSIDREFLGGAVKAGEDRETIGILNPEPLLQREFASIGSSSRRATTAVSIAPIRASAAAPSQQMLSLISFEVQHQEYALPLESVREIIQLPEHVSQMPRVETAVLGVVTLRDRLLPLVSLRALLGLPARSETEQGGKVVVLPLGNGSVGIVADRTNEILRVGSDAIDPAPALLTRGAGDAEITSICRVEHGKRLVALLSPDRLFRSELMKRVVSNEGYAGKISGETDGQAMPEQQAEQFVVFRLGAQEYGMPIDAVREIARMPEQITRLPKAPAFIHGVMNLRGSVVPIVDLRRRFDIRAENQGSGQRVLVLLVDGRLTGFMVDGVSEVLKVLRTAISAAPDLSAEQMRLIGRVANLDSDGRILLLVDPAQLLDKVEAEVLAKFGAAHSGQAQKAS